MANLQTGFYGIIEGRLLTLSLKTIMPGWQLSRTAMDWERTAKREGHFFIRTLTPWNVSPPMTYQWESFGALASFTLTTRRSGTGRECLHRSSKALSGVMLPTMAT